MGVDTSAPGRTWTGPALWVALAVVLRSGAAAFAKQAGLWSAGGALRGLVVNPWWVASLVLLVAQAVAWIVVLRRVRLTVAYPFNSLVLAINLAVAVFVFGEAIAGPQVLGILLIMSGIAVLGSGTRREGGEGR